MLDIFPRMFWGAPVHTCFLARYPFMAASYIRSDLRAGAKSYRNSAVDLAEGPEVVRTESFCSSHTLAAICERERNRIETRRSTSLKVPRLCAHSLFVRAMGCVLGADARSLVRSNTADCLRGVYSVLLLLVKCVCQTRWRGAM